MPGVERLSADLLAREAEALAALGIKAVLLFGIPSTKDASGSESHAEDGVVQQAIRTLKDARPDLVVVADASLLGVAAAGVLSGVDEQTVRCSTAARRRPSGAIA